MFDVVRFETLHQAQNGPVILAEQIHHLALPGRVSAPVHNMAYYEVSNNQIMVWRDYTNSQYANQLLQSSQVRD